MNIKLSTYLCGLLGLALCACSQDGGEGLDLSTEGIDAVAFSANVSNKSVNTETRATTEVETTLLDSDPHWDKFTIYMSVAEGAYSKPTYQYIVPSGKTGIFDYETDSYADTDKPLNWKNSTDMHRFISWNQPRIADYKSSYTTQPTQLVQMRDGDATGTVYFSRNELVSTDDDIAGSSREDDNYFSRRLTYFVGTRTDPVNYQTNGVSVKMVFKRLVSNIIFENITLTQSDGAVKSIVNDTNRKNTDLYKSVEISFPNMPRKGILHTGIAEGENFDPYVEMDTEAGKGLTSYNADGNGNGYGYGMFFPPFDFKDYGDFIITIKKTEGDGYSKQMYYGSLYELIESNAFGDATRTGIKAGEQMHLNLHLTDGKVTGVSAYIVDWDDVDLPSTTLPVKKGIYTKDEFYDMLSNNNYSQYADNNGVVHVYTDCYFTTIESDASFTIPEGYTIDGLGHNIDMLGYNLNLIPSSSVKDLYVNNEYVYNK